MTSLRSWRPIWRRTCRFFTWAADNAVTVSSKDNSDLYVVQPVQLDVPSLEVNIDHPWLCLVEVQGLHHLSMRFAMHGDYEEDYGQGVDP